MQLLYAPPGSDFVLAGTTKRQLLAWQFNPHAAHRWGTHGHPATQDQLPPLQRGLHAYGR